MLTLQLHCQPDQCWKALGPGRPSHPQRGVLHSPHAGGLWDESSPYCGVLGGLVLLYEAGRFSHSPAGIYTVSHLWHFGQIIRALQVQGNLTAAAASSTCKLHFNKTAISFIFSMTCQPILSSQWCKIDKMFVLFNFLSSISFVNVVIWCDLKNSLEAHPCGYRIKGSFISLYPRACFWSQSSSSSSSSSQETFFFSAFGEIKNTRFVFSNLHLSILFILDPH